MAPIDSGEFIVIGMAGKTPDRLVEAVPADARRAYIVGRDEHDTCAEQAENARKVLAGRDPSVRAEIVKCDIYDPLSCFALVDRLIRQHAGAKFRVVIGTGTNVFAAAAYQAACTHGTDILNITEDRGQDIVRQDHLKLLPAEPEDDVLVALNIVAGEKDGRITGRRLHKLLKSFGRPVPKPDDLGDGGPKKSNRGTDEQRRGVRAQRFIVDRLERGGLLDTPESSRGIPFSYLDRTYALSDTAKRIVAAYGHRFPREKWSALR